MKLIPPATVVCLFILVILYFNSYSIALWTNGFSNKNVYENISINNGSNVTQAVLVANDKHFGILNMSKNSIGLWVHNDVGPSIIEKNSHFGYISMTSYSRFYMLTSSIYNYANVIKSSNDFFIAGLIDKAETEKVYSLPQQPGCLVSADFYQLSGNQFLILFHITTNDANSLDNAKDNIEKSFKFEKSVISD